MTEMTSPVPLARTAVIVGASGGIGAALMQTLSGRGELERLFALSRRRPPDLPHKASWLPIDLEQEATLEAAAAAIGEADLVIVATGLLQDQRQAVERSYRALTAEAMARSYLINTIGPALVAKAFLPRLPKDRRSVFAVLSARVGSISDNGLGGWHSYRASKAALNMMVRTLSIEVRRERPLALCVALHPGTVATPLSAPFQKGVPPEKLFSPELGAEQLLRVVEGLSPRDTGRIFAWDGSEIAP